MRNSQKNRSRRVSVVARIHASDSPLSRPRKYQITISRMPSRLVSTASR
jgi:hypothetical protein